VFDLPGIFARRSDDSIGYWRHTMMLSLYVAGFALSCFIGAPVDSTPSHP
jgi:hypothetical protein